MGKKKKTKVVVHIHVNSLIPLDVKKMDVKTKEATEKAIADAMLRVINSAKEVSNG